MTNQTDLEKVLPIGSKVVASCPFHGIIDAPGEVVGYVNKNIYPSGHGEYLIKFESETRSSFGCDSKDVALCLEVQKMTEVGE